MIYDFDTAVCLARSPVSAESALMRLRGMIGRHFHDRMDAMIFRRCQAVHTLFMAIPIDVLFLDRESRVVKVERRLPAWRFYAGVRGAVTTVEFPAGSLDGVEPGHRILLDQAPDQQTLRAMKNHGGMKESLDL